MFKKVKEISLGLARTIFFDWFYRDFYAPENCGDEVARVAGETVEIICATDSVEPLDQENSKNAMRIWLRRFAVGFNLRIKKILKEWE